MCECERRTRRTRRRKKKKSGMHCVVKIRTPYRDVGNKTSTTEFIRPPNFEYIVCSLSCPPNFDYRV
jgi:hypothetical protein